MSKVYDIRFKRYKNYKSEFVTKAQILLFFYVPWLMVKIKMLDPA